MGDNTARGLNMCWQDIGFYIKMKSSYTWLDWLFNVSAFQFAETITQGFVFEPLNLHNTYSAGQCQILTQVKSIKSKPSHLLIRHLVVTDNILAASILANITHVRFINQKKAHTYLK